jgi:hypothetical protein
MSIFGGYVKLRNGKCQELSHEIADKNPLPPGFNMQCGCFCDARIGLAVNSAKFKMVVKLPSGKLT